MRLVLAFLLISPIFVVPLLAGRKLIKSKRARDSHAVWLAGVIMLVLGAIWLFIFITAVLPQL